MGQKSKRELKVFFTKDSIPTTSQYADLIDSSLNVSDGGSVSNKLTSNTRNETWGTSVAAAGGDQAAATEITIDGGIIAVTAADNSKGVKLPAISTLAIGDRVKIWNSVTNKTLEVYPASGDRIFPAADDAPVTIAACGWLELIVYSTDGWAGNEGVIGA